ncbi:MAG: sulfatase-like hydrolase/transferase [Halioglobus sp.]|nr:sulfatase-like hydrolase/transferase [Halioglobus sp.]
MLPSRQPGKAAEYTQAYLASVSHTDAMIGQVLDALADSPYAANTTVVLFSDNGFHLGEEFHWRKRTFWEQSARVPLLIKSPGNPDYPVGDVTEEVSLLDLAATVLDLAGQDPEPQFEGAPLHDAANRSAVEIFLDNGIATVEAGIKRIDYDTAVPGLGDREKYDLASDPMELTNLIPPGC